MAGAAQPGTIRPRLSSAGFGKADRILTRISDRKMLRPEDERGNQFFLDIRSRIVFAYYTSEVGLMQELTYKGKQVLGHWEGCPHEDRHGDSE